MAKFDGMNTTTNTPSAVGGIGSTLATGSGGVDGLDVGYKIVIIVSSIIGAIVGLATLITLIYKCCKKCRQRAGNVQQLSTSVERIGLNTLNADTGNDGRHLQEPASARCVDEGTVLLQKKLQRVYKDLFIPKRPDNIPSSSIAEVGELYTELELFQAIEESFNKKLTTRDGEISVRKPRTISLDSWRDLLNPDKIRNLMIILSGGAGFGKTTLFKRIAHTWATSNQLVRFKLLFRIELKKMKTSSIIDAIIDQCFLRDKRPDRDDLIRIITDNQSESVFLLDGLDELNPGFLEPSEDDYSVHNVLHKEALQQSRVLVATRLHKVADIIEGYPRSVCVETSGFTEKNTEQYIRKYFEDDEEKGPELIEIMKTKESLRQLAHIPVFCQIVCHIFTFGERQLPDRLAQLYRKFMEFLAKRRCGKDWKQRLETALSVLGHVAWDGLLDNHQPVLTQREFDDCASVLDDTSERSGFIQQETYESVDGLTVIVTFLHMTFQEYCAAYYFAKLYHADEEEFRFRFKRINPDNIVHHADEEEEKFHEKLQQINPDNVLEMEYLLRFACGILKDSPATRLILEHVQKQHQRRELKLQNLVRLLLYESGSDKMAKRLDRPTRVVCDSQEELLAMRYYLQCLRRPLEELKDFTVYCTSHDDLTLLRDINGLLRCGNTAIISPSFYITCRSHEDVTLLRQMVLSGNIRPVTGSVYSKPFWVTYIISEQANEDMQTLEETLEGMDERGLRDQISLTLEINETSHFDDESVSGSRVRRLIEAVNLRNRTYDDVRRLVNALDERGCENGLTSVDMSDTNLHDHLRDVRPLVTPSMWVFGLRSCGLNDDDVPDLISLLRRYDDECDLPYGGHCLLNVGGNAFSADGVRALTDYYREMLLLDY